MSDVRVVFEKWGALPHWEYDARVLGEDEHGTWLGVRAGTRIARPDAAFVSQRPQVVLVPEAGYVATFYTRGEGPVDIYVDITTPPVFEGTTLRMVDLDLDVVRGWSGRVWVDDEDEFAEHRVRFGYPEETVRHAVETCELVRRAVTAADIPFDEATSNRWMDALGGA